MSKEIKGGERSVMASEGNKKDAAANKEDSQANPFVEKRSIKIEEKDLPGYAEIGVTFGLTLSIGNFEFSRFDITQKEFCLPDDESKAQKRREVSKEVTDYAFNACKHVKKYLTEKREGLGF